MVKVMSKEIKEASIGEFIVAEDLLNSPVKLRIVGSELQKDAIETNNGKLMDKVIFYFEDGEGTKKSIGVFSFDSLVRQMNAADPNIGDILQLETINITGSKYLVWKVKVVRKSTSAPEEKRQQKRDTGEVTEEDLPAKTEGQVDKNEDEEEIKIEDIPF